MPHDNIQEHRHESMHFYESGDVDAATIREISQVTWFGVIVNVGLAVFKTVGGVIAGSHALLADAVHTLSDLATDAAILVGVRYWSAPADADHPHGHRKIETMVTLGIGAALALVGAAMGYNAVANLARAIMHGVPSRSGPVPGEWIALAAAFSSIVSKELLYRWTAAKGVALGSSAVVANAWHHRSDAFSSIPPVIVIGAEMAAAGWGHNLWFLDPIGTVVVCVMLLQAAWEVAAPTLSALLDASADRKFCSAIRQTVLTAPGVMGFHKIRTRCVGSKAVAVDLHILVKDSLTVADGHRIAADVKYRILGLDMPGARAVDVMVHVEPADADTPILPGVSSTGTDWKGCGNETE